MGFEGEGLGISAQAAALIRLGGRIDAGFAADSASALRALD